MIPNWLKKAAILNLFEDHALKIEQDVFNSKLFEKLQKVYYQQVFTIEEVIYDINNLKSSHKKFTIATLFTIDQFATARFDCILVNFIAIQ